MSVTTVEQRIAEIVAVPRFRTLILGLFAVLGYVLAVLGVYGVTSYVVTQQLRDLGVRVALGAQSNDILKHVLGRGLVVTLIGIAMGVSISLVITRGLSSFLYEVRPTDSTIFLASALVLCLSAMLASFIPARRATKVDPAEVLRYE